MAKSIFQDMVKVRREQQETISKKVVSPNSIKIIKNNFPPKDLPREIRNETKEEKKGTRYGMWFLAIVAVVFLFFAVSLLFVEAKVTVNPEIKEVTLDKNFSAIKSGATSGVSFDLMVLSNMEERTVTGGEEKEVSRSATGKAKIFNSFSSAPQTLDIDTRLEGTNGKIYKTDKKIIVPGMKSDGTPGSVLVGIYGSEAGEGYNSLPIDFKIVGFKGSPKYEKFYGRSEGEISGGMTGVTIDIPEEERKKVVSDIQATLKQKLIEKARGQIPAGFVLWDDAIFIEIDSEKISTGTKEGTTLISMKGTLYGFLFEEKNISTEIIREAVTDYDGSEAYVTNLKELNFSLSDKENISSGNVNSVKNINFSLLGTPKIVYRINSTSLAAELLGKSKDDFERMLSRYPHIESAELVLQPVWKKTFPDNLKDIEIVVNYP